MSAPREVRWERMFPDEVEAAFATTPLAYLPYGLCEPHGPQNALGLDALKAHAVCVKAARLSGGIVAPASYWHVQEVGISGAWSHDAIGSVPRSWLTAVPPWHHYKSVLYHLRTIDAHGFHAALLVTGHDAWTDDLVRLVELVQPHIGTRIAGLGDWAGNVAGVDHAGRIETSLLWALEPESVDVSRLPAGEELPWAMGPDAKQADRRDGEAMADREAEHLASVATGLLAEYERGHPEHSLRTYGDVEQLWADVVLPVVPELLSMREQAEEDGIVYGPVPDDSPWFANWRVPRDRVR